MFLSGFPVRERRTISGAGPDAGPGAGEGAGGASFALVLPTAEEIVRAGGFRGFEARVLRRDAGVVVIKA